MSGVSEAPAIAVRVRSARWSGELTRRFDKTIAGNEASLVKEARSGSEANAGDEESSGDEANAGDEASTGSNVGSISTATSG